MYIEDKSAGIEGPARIGEVTYSKSGRSVFYGGREYHRSQNGSKSNYIEIKTGSPFWISGPKKRGGDRLNGCGIVEIDENVRVAYWTLIRQQPELAHLTSYRD